MESAFSASHLCVVCAGQAGEETLHSRVFAFIGGSRERPFNREWTRMNANGTLMSMARRGKRFTAKIAKNAKLKDGKRAS